MDYSSLPGSPAPGSGSTTPLQPVSHNQQRDRENAMSGSSLFASFRRAQTSDDARDSSVHDKINQFNSLAMQSKQLERKTADAALKRAMLGREEAETEMRRYREEARQLRKQVDEGKERERRVGERLETVMENYGRSKETHAHTQALWEKEIRRARKETFKAQSALVKLQEELKSCRAAQKLAEEELEREKERSKAREQEAFYARYNLVGLQEQLDQALERVKMLEQERDAFKTLAKNEEDVARIAAEGKLPLPAESDVEDVEEYASPKQRPRLSSISVVDIVSSASSEAEIDELTRLWQWEKQRAERALEHVQFLEAECHLRCCLAGKSMRVSRSSIGAQVNHRKRASVFNIADAGDLVILSEKAKPIPGSPTGRPPSPKRSKTEKLREEKEARRSTVFVPSEGIFRTVSQAETVAPLNEALQPQQAISIPIEPAIVTKTVSLTSSIPPSEPPTPADAMPPVFARTPSVDPPDFAIPTGPPRTSLLSLLDAPHEPEPPIKGFHVPTTPGPLPTAEEQPTPADETASSPEEADTTIYHSIRETNNISPDANSEQGALGEPVPSGEPAVAENEPIIRPHTSAAFYAVSTVTTTTKVPLREETQDPSLASRLMKMQRTPSRAGDTAEDGPSFDVNNPALTPTMTREQALAQIRERRVRARSVGKIDIKGTTKPASSKPAVTPRRQMIDKERRDVSAPNPSSRIGGLGVTPHTRRVRS